MEYPEYKIPEYDIPYYEDNARVSNSAIGWFLNKGPAYFRRMLDGKEKGLDLPQLRRGTMIHEFLLQPDQFWDDYMWYDGSKPKSAQAQSFCENLINSVEIELNKRLSDAYRKSYSIVGKSEDKILSEALKISVEYKDYIDALKSRKILISQRDAAQLADIKDNIEAHKMGRRLLRNIGPHDNFHVYHEFQINWIHNDVQCKSLLDSCTFYWDTKVCIIMDLKTTGKLWHFEDSMKEFDYCRQLCFYKQAVYYYMINTLGFTDDQLKDWKFRFYIVAIDVTGSNEIRVFNLTSEQISLEESKINDAIDNIQWHIKSGVWDHSRTYYEGDGSETLNL